MGRAMTDQPAASKTPLVDQTIAAAFRLMARMAHGGGAAENQPEADVRPVERPEAAQGKATDGPSVLRKQLRTPKAQPPPPGLPEGLLEAPQANDTAPPPSPKPSRRSFAWRGSVCAARVLADVCCSAFVDGGRAMLVSPSVPWTAKILSALWYSAGPSGKLTETQWILSAWRLWPKEFGLKDAIEYPDAARVRSKIAGSDGLVGKGFVTRDDAGFYSLTAAGRTQLLNVVGMTREAFYSLRLVCKAGHADRCSLSAASRSKRLDSWLTRKKGPST